MVQPVVVTSVTGAGHLACSESSGRKKTSQVAFHCVFCVVLAFYFKSQVFDFRTCLVQGSEPNREVFREDDNSV